MATRRAPTLKERATGERLKALRKARGLRVCDVSRHLDMSDQNYMWYEQGRNTIKAQQLRPLAEVLGVSPHELFESLYPVDPSFRSWESAHMPVGRLPEYT